MKVLKKVGFESMDYFTGSSEEAETQQLLGASTQAQQKEQPSNGTSQNEFMISTVVYKLVDDTEIHAIYTFRKGDQPNRCPLVNAWKALSLTLC